MNGLPSRSSTRARKTVLTILDDSLDIGLGADADMIDDSCLISIKHALLRLCRIFAEELEAQETLTCSFSDDQEGRHDPVEKRRS
jgi:hypothetical protein